MELNMGLHTPFCFTLVFENVVRGYVVDRWSVQRVNYRVGSGCLTGLGANHRWGMGLGTVLETFLGSAHRHKAGTGFGMDKLQQWGARGV